MAYETNRFCWHGLVTSDPDGAASFYPEVLGWTVETIDMGDGEVTTFAAGGVPLTHYSRTPNEGVPTHWSNYLRVDDVDASTKAAVANGGTVLLDPQDIPPGRLSLVQTPSGAPLHLFHEADEAAAHHHPGGLGGVHWTELRSTEIGPDLQWLESTFGFGLREIPMPGGKYFVLTSGGKDRAGVMMAEAPAMWLTWFRVDDTESAIARVERHGGKILGPAMEMEGIGTIALATDPDGAAFGLIRPLRLT